MEDKGSEQVVSPKAQEGVIGWIESVLITAMQTSVGQTLYKFIDSFLWAVEKSAQWSLPAQEIAAEENGKSFGKIELVRPLPWIFFLPGLVILRIIRAGLNMGALVLGYPRIQPSGMVKYVQRYRRRLRAFHLKAIKSVRPIPYNRKDTRRAMIKAKKALIRSIRLTLSTLSCLNTSKPLPSPPPTKIHISNIGLETVATPDAKSTTESAGSPMHTDAKRKHSEITTDDESIDESENEMSMFDNLTMDDDYTDEVPDYTQSDCSTITSTASSESEVDKNISVSEVEDILKESHEFLNNDDLKMRRKLSPESPKKESTPTNSEKEQAATSIKEEASPTNSKKESTPSNSKKESTPINTKQESTTKCTKKESTPTNITKETEKPAPGEPKNAKQKNRVQNSAKV